MVPGQLYLCFVLKLLLMSLKLPFNGAKKVIRKTKAEPLKLAVIEYLINKAFIKH